MALCEVYWFSQTLDRRVSMNVILPEVGKPPYATFYLLHGLSDDHTRWARQTSIERYVEGLPLIVVMPDGARGFYTRHNQGHDYAKYIAQDVVQFVERNFPARPRRQSRCIGGLSMGGYGALRIALGYPDLFISATSHSGALMIGSRKRKGTVLADWEYAQIFGRNPVGTDHDLLHLAMNARQAGRLPKIRIDCGTEDFLFQDNREFTKRLTEMGVPHEYEEFPGAHNWTYWDEHVQDALKFHAKHLKLKV